MTIRFTESTKPTLSDIIDATQIPTVCFSPSGSHVAYTTKPYGKRGKDTLSALWLAETDKPSSARMLTSNLHNDRLPRWSSDGRRIAFVSDRAGKETCAIYVLDIQAPGGEPIPVTDVKCRKNITGVQWSEDGKYIGYLSADETFDEDEKRKEAKADAVVIGERLQYNRLRLLDVEKQETSVLFKRNAHVSVFGWSPDDKEVMVLTQKDPGDNSPLKYGQEFERVSVDDGQTTHIVHFPTNASDGGPNPLVWSKEDDVYFVANYPADAIGSSQALYKLSLSDKKFAKESYGDSDCAVSLRLATASSTMYAKSEEGFNDVLRICNATSGDAHVNDRQITAWDAVKTSSGSKFVYVYSEPTAPPEVYVQDESGKQTQLSAHAESIFEEWAPSCSVHRLTWKTPSAAPSASSTDKEESFTLEGLLVSPRSEKTPSKPLPTVVIVHGGPYYRQSSSFLAPHKPWLPALLSTGKFNILLPNYRGNSSQGKGLASAINGKAGAVDYDDMLAMVDEGIAKGFVDRERVAISGWSWGGMMAYVAATTNGTDSAGRDKGWRFQGAICGAGAVDGDMMTVLSDMWTHRSVSMGQLPWTSYIDDTTNRAGSAMWKVRKAVEEKRIPPVLILHGLADPRVPVQNAYAFKRAMDHYGIDCEAVLYPREPHSFAERGSQLDMMERVIAFCEKVLKV